MYFSDIFRQENPNFSRCFRVGKLKYSFYYQFSLTVSSPKTIVFLVLRMRCQMGKWFVFVAYWCFSVTKDCFERSFPSKTERFLPFSRTENAQKTLENNVPSKKKKKMFSGVFLLFALRKRVVIGDSPNAVIPTQFQVVAVRLSCKKLFFFPIFIGVLHH